MGAQKGISLSSSGSTLHAFGIEDDNFRREKMLDEVGKNGNVDSMSE